MLLGYPQSCNLALYQGLYTIVLYPCNYVPFLKLKFNATEEIKAGRLLYFYKLTNRIKHIYIQNMILPQALSYLLLSSYTSLFMKWFFEFTPEADTKMLITITSQDVHIVTSAKNRTLFLFYHFSRRHLNTCYYIDLLKTIDYPDISWL